MFNKKGYRFELSQAKNISVDTIRNAADLINFIIGENQSLLDAKEVGTVVVSKIETTKKGERILFAQRLELPMPGKTNFDALLEHFYTKKPLEFDEQVLKDEEKRPPRFQYQEENLQSIPSSANSSSLLPNNDYAPAPTIDLTDSEEGEGTTVVTAGEPPIPSSHPLTEEDINRIVSKQMSEKDHEIQQLKAALQAKEEMEVKLPSSLNSPIPAHEVEQEEISANLALSATLDLSEDTNVLDVIQLVKDEANQRLNEFIAQETAKIEGEIEALDTRDRIEEELTKRFESEKYSKVETLNQTIDTEKEMAIASENARHKAALTSIETEHETNRTAKLQALKEEFTNKLSSAIKEEYECQTEQLNLILQGKTEELQLRQKAVNEGMKNTVVEVLEGFNTHHGEVIQTVERRKNSSDVISLHQRVG